MTPAATICRYLSPPAVAEALGCNQTKILGWIRSGELRGVNVAAKVGGRPRWRISLEDLEGFLQRRAASPVPKVARRRTRRTELDVVKFF